MTQTIGNYLLQVNVTNSEPKYFGSKVQMASELFLPSVAGVCVCVCIFETIRIIFSLAKEQVAASYRVSMLQGKQEEIQTLFRKTCKKQLALDRKDLFGKYNCY